MISFPSTWVIHPILELARTTFPLSARIALQDMGQRHSCLGKTPAWGTRSTSSLTPITPMATKTLRHGSRHGATSLTGSWAGNLLGQRRGLPLLMSALISTCLCKMRLTLMGRRTWLVCAPGVWFRSRAYIDFPSAIVSTIQKVLRRPLLPSRRVQPSGENVADSRFLPRLC